jgi:fructokinase
VDPSDLKAPRYRIREPAAWDAVECKRSLLELAQRAEGVSFGTLFQRDGRSRKALHAFLSAAEDAYCLYDLNLRQDYYDRAVIEASLEAADAVKLNDLEAVVLAKVIGATPRSSEELADLLRTRYGVEETCVTHGGRGCVVFGRDETVRVLGHPVPVADTLGVGDAFDAAFLTARIAGEALAETAHFANAVGALAANCPGPMPALAKAYESIAKRTLRSTRIRADRHVSRPAERGWRS